MNIEYMKESIAVLYEANEKLRTENEALKAKHTEPAQEPEPVAWMRSDKGDLRLSHHGGYLPLYTAAPPDAAKRIAELESACKAHAELHEINEKRIGALEARIHNGVRVYAERGFDNDWEAYGRWHKPANATLILDEGE